MHNNLNKMAHFIRVEIQPEELNHVKDKTTYYSRNETIICPSFFFLAS